MRDPLRPVPWLPALFFVSGFPALLYQIVWQRKLMAIFGVNIESVTVVVTAFLLGLGLGSLAGGRLSQHPRAPLPLLFGVIELGIAAYGALSLRAFAAVEQIAAGAPPGLTFLASFALVLIPTLLMGSTLPLLTTYLARRSGSVGRSVGLLYSLNTFGSAAACLAAAWWTLPALGLSGTVSLAASINAAVGLSALLLLRPRPADAAPEQEPAPPAAAALPFPAALALAALTGFLSLGFEMVWYRAYSFVTGGSPYCFSYVLAAFLAGIAGGSLAAGRWCRRAGIGHIAALIAGATLLAFLTIPLLAHAVRYLPYEATLPAVALAAALLGAAFPLLCHLAVRRTGSAGAGLSYLYLANIAGSAAGSHAIGLGLLEWWGLAQLAAFLAATGAAAAAVAWGSATGRWRAALPAGAAAAAAIAASSSVLYSTLYERLLYKEEWTPALHFRDLVETRSGVVTVDAAAHIYGGGAHDGVLSSDLLTADSCIRPYSLSYLHPAPRRVLLIGVAGGAWARIIANHPQLESATAVEINPGYLTVIARYPAVAPLLRHPKLHIAADDGRRWMAAHRDERFDAILMDTVQHWRAEATNLLSVEMLTLARGMLRPGGVLYYNTTYSGDAQRTGLTVFPHGLRFGPFLALSMTPLDLNLDRWRRTLAAYRMEGRPVLDPADPRAAARLEQIAAYLRTDDPTGEEHFATETAASVRRRTARARLVTDDNMATEWQP